MQPALPSRERRRTVVLVLAAGALDPGCEEALRRLERAGCAVWTGRGPALSDTARSLMATDALAQGFEELVWVGADVIFRPEDLDRLRGHALPLVCGLTPQAGGRGLACSFLPGGGAVRLGVAGGLMEVRSCGFGFAYTRRELYHAVRERLGLPACRYGPGRTLVPFFSPLTLTETPGPLYLDGEDAFCERARQCRFRVMADTAVRLWRVGTYRYGWEDAAGPRPRSDDFTLTPGAAAPGEPPTPQPAPAGPEPPVPATAFRGEARPLPDGFPRLRAYTLTYRANADSLRLTLESFRQTDWGEEPVVFVRPPDWPPGRDNGSRNYKRVLERAAADGCDFALVFQDDVRFGRHLRHNLTTLPLVRRDQCDYLSLFIPDLIVSPWERSEPHLGYRLARPLYSGPNQGWEAYRIWGAQAYLLSRRFVLAALERWERLQEGQDARVVSVCSELRLPLWYTAPCLVEHAPLRSVFGTPAAYAPDFDPDFRLEVGPGYQPPEAVPGPLTLEEGKLLWQVAAGRGALELGTGRGRATVCLAQQAQRVTGVDRGDLSEAAEWARRFGAAGRVELHRGEPADVCRRLRGPFGLALVAGEQDAAGVARGVEAVLPLLEPGGLVAFHDYPDPRRPQVRAVVDDYARRLGWKRSAQAGFLGVFATPTAAR